MAYLMEPCTMLWANPCCHGNEIWANLVYFVTKSPISQFVCQIDRICLGLPGETTRGPIFVATATTFALGAESNRLYRLVFIYVYVPIALHALHPLRSLDTSVLSHFGPRTDLHIHFGPQSVRSSVISVLRTEVAQPVRSFAQSRRSRDDYRTTNLVQSAVLYDRMSSVRL